MRSSKFRALLLMLLLSFTGRIYLQAQPLAQPNWYAPVGYFSELARDLSEAKGEGKTISILQLGDSHIQEYAIYHIQTAVMQDSRPTRCR